MDREFLSYTALSLAGPVIWSVHFAVVYGIQHLICSTGFLPGRFVMPIILGATLIAILLIAGCTWGTLKGGLLSEVPGTQVVLFYKYVSGFMLILSFFAVLATCAAGLMLPACQDLR